MRIKNLTTAAALLTATALDAGAETLRWARAGDSHYPAACKCVFPVALGAGG